MYIWWIKQESESIAGILSSSILWIFEHWINLIVNSGGYREWLKCRCKISNILASKGCNAKGSQFKILEAFWEYSAGSPRAVPTAFLPCQSSACRTCCQQQVRTCVFRCWQHGDAQEEPLCTAAGVNVSISKYLIHCQGTIVSFFCSK